MSHKPWPVRLHLSLLIASVAIPLVTLVGVVVFSALRAQRDVAEQQSLQLARLIAAGTADTFADVRTELKTVGGWPEVRGGAQSCGLALQRAKLLDPAVVVLSYVNMEGAVVCSTENVGAEAAFASLRDAAAATGFGQVTSHTPSAGWTTTFGQVAFDASDAPVGMMLGQYDFGTYQFGAAALTLPPGAIYGIIDASGTVIQASEGIAGWQGRSLVGTPLDTALTGSGGSVFTAAGPDGRDQAFGAAPVAGAGGWVIVGLPAAGGFGSLADVGWWLAAAGVLAFAIVAAASMFFFRRIEQPIRSLVMMVRQATTGQRQLVLPGGPEEITVIGREVSAMLAIRAQAADALNFQALHDSLTGLPNRALLFDRLEYAILSAKRSRSTIAFLVIDLDRFRDVNETLSHTAGDMLLQAVAGRFQQMLRSSDTVARLGGDEFGVLMPSTGTQGAVVAANKLLAVLEAPFTVEGHRIDISASIGIVLYPEHGKTATLLMQRADIAMYDAKRANRSFAFFNAESNTASPDRLAMVGELRDAVHNGELELWFQPKMQMDTDEVLGVEALVRWRHPRRGIISPAEFIPLAEETGLIRPLTHWVIETSIRQWKNWHLSGLDLPIAVNISLKNLEDQQLPETIESLLAEWDVTPSALTLELTESAIMLDSERATENLRRLETMGIGLSIDDFGTGYSSLSHLGRLPVSQIKIDRSFVQQMMVSDHDRTIVQATINLGRSLGMQVVAEGVEDEPTWQLLRGLGCDVGQGYHIRRPAVPSEIVTWLRNSGRRGAGPQTLAA